MNNLPQLPSEMLVQQIQNGLVLLMLGMGVVFVFLVILVFSTKGVSKFVRKIEKPTVVAPVAAPAPVAVVSTASNDAEIAVAIAAATARAKK